MGDVLSREMTKDLEPLDWRRERGLAFGEQK